MATVHPSWIAVAALAFATPGGRASPPPEPTPEPAPPCRTAEARQLDFWVGTWRGRWIDAQGQPASASNVVRRELGGCAVHEHFRQDGPGGLEGRSLSVFDGRAQRWRQTWVDNQGGYLTLTGGLDDGVFTLGHGITTREQRQVLLRMRFVDVSAERFTWLWQRSLDGGQQWETTWTIRYERAAP